MAQLLEKLNSLVRKRQAEQMLEIMSKKQSNGEIDSVKDFTQKLDDLVRQISQVHLEPTLKLFKASKTTDPDTYNFMLERIYDDLITAFEEGNNINEIQEAHNFLIKDVILKNLRHSLAELEAKTTIYEFLNQTNFGFNNALYSTFQEAKIERLNQNDKDKLNLFKDPRSGQLFNNNEAAIIDSVGEQLILASSNSKSYYTCSKVEQLYDSTALQSEYNTEQFDINNIIDNQNNTLWTNQYIVFTKVDYIDCKIAFNFDSVKNINFLEINTPSTKEGFTLYQIYYCNENGEQVLLKTIDEVIVSDYSFYFQSINTNQIILVFRLDTPLPIQFQLHQWLYNDLQKLVKFYSNYVDTYREAHAQSSFYDLMTYLGYVVPKTYQFSSQHISDWLPNQDNTVYSLSCYTYNIVLDNVKFGLTNFANKSIYISQPLKSNKVSQIGLKTTEVRPSTTSGINGTIQNTSETYNVDDDIFLTGSIEYWVIKENLNSQDSIISTQVMPILPTGITRINHERLLLTERSSSSTIFNDTGYTCFFTNDDDGEIKLYRNGILMNSGEWVNISTTEDLTPNSSKRMAAKIKIYNVYPGEIFTISYNPLSSTTLSVPLTPASYSSSGLSLVDLIGNLSARAIENQIILIDNSITPDVKNTNIYFMIILRNNTNVNYTPIVKDYMLLLGTTDEQ